MTNFVGLVTFLLALIASSCISGQECTRPRDVIKNSECSTCKKLSLPTDTCFEADHCHWCCECPPGTYVAKNCISLNDRDPTSTICEPCDPGFYTSTNNNATSCIKSKSEDFCKRLQYTKFVQGSLEKDGRCECVTGTYSPDPESGGCKKHNPCAKGFGVKIPGNETHDVQCEYCPEGMCSDEESSTQKCHRCDEQSGNKTSVLTTPSPLSTTNAIPVDKSTAQTPSSEAITDSRGLMGLMFVIGFLAGAILVFVGIFGCRVHQRRKREKKREQRKKRDRDERERDTKSPESVVFIKVSDSEGQNAELEKEDIDEDFPPDEDLHRNNSKKPLIDKKTSRPTESEKEPKEESPQKRETFEPVIREEASPPIESGKALEKEGLQTAEPFEKEDTFVSLKQERNGQGPTAERPVKEPLPEDVVKGPVSELHEDPSLDDEAVPCATEPPNPKSRNAHLTEDEYKQIFQENGYEVTFNPDSNGNCQFSAIISLLYPGLSREEINEKARDLRRQVIDYMEIHPQQFQNFTADDWNTYLTKMSKISEYGDNLTVQAASNVRQRTFKIIQTSNPEEPVIIAPTNLAQPQPAENVFVLGHVDENHGMHYVCLKLKTSERTSPIAQTPMSDSRVEQDSQFRFDKIPAPSQLASPNSASQNGLFSPMGNLPASESRQEQAPSTHQQLSPTALPSPSENEPYVQQQNNVSNGIAEHLELFVNDQDKAILSQVPADVLQGALDSKDYLHQMLLGRYGLHKDTSTQDLKDFIRQNRLIGNETDIEDIENENAKNHKEMRTKLLQKAQQEQGKKLTPRKILKLTVEHRPRKIYDDLCIAFIKYMQQNLNAGES